MVQKKHLEGARVLQPVCKDTPHRVQDHPLHLALDAWQVPVLCAQQPASQAKPAAAESRTSRLGSHTMPATTGHPGNFGGDGSKLMGSCKEKCMASINAVDDRSACKGTPASCRSRVPSASTASAVYFSGTSYAQCATCASFAARISDPSAAGDNDLNTAYCARSAMAQALPLTMTVGVAVQCSRNCDTDARGVPVFSENSAKTSSRAFLIHRGHTRVRLPSLYSECGTVTGQFKAQQPEFWQISLDGGALQKLQQLVLLATGTASWFGEV